MVEPLPVSGGEIELIPDELERCIHAGEQTLIGVYENKAQQVRMLMEIGFVYAPTPATPGSLQGHPYVCGDDYAVVVEEMDTRDRLLEALGAEMCP